MILKILFSVILQVALAKDENVLTTEVFAIILDPPMFNWTYEGVKDQFVYQANLLGLPDLPSWINYVYSDQHHSGFLYGVPPKTHKGKIPLEVIALNKKNYESRKEILNVIISEKRSQAKFEVHLKIDNLNVVDMFDVDRMEALKDVFRKQLWKGSESDLYITFLSSAVELGARKPLNPNEGEGVVLRLGSEFMFSSELVELQEEVKPLWKVPACPRDFKRTSVERFFRDGGFSLDWCTFRLIDNTPTMHHSEAGGNTLYNEDEIIYNFNDRWQSISSFDVPRRNYYKELIVSILVPLLILLTMGMILTFLLCFYTDEIVKQIRNCASEDFDNFPNLQSANESLRNFAIDQSISPDLRSHANSPNSTIGRGVHCRPSPPPYVRPKYKPEL